MGEREQARTGGSAALRAGDRARDFTLTAADGHPVSLRAELAKGPVVLSFLDRWRPGGADTELSPLSSCAAQVREQGGGLFAISSVTWPNTKAPPGFHVLHDVGHIVAGQYGISAPASFVIDRTAMIVLSLIDAVPGGDLSCANIMSALSALRRMEQRQP